MVSRRIYRYLLKETNKLQKAWSHLPTSGYGRKLSLIRPAEAGEFNRHRHLPNGIADCSVLSSVDCAGDLMQIFADPLYGTTDDLKNAFSYFFRNTGPVNTENKQRAFSLLRSFDKLVRVDEQSSDNSEHGIRLLACSCHANSEESSFSDRSEMVQNVFVYRIMIANERETPVRLLGRRWIFSSYAGESWEIRGDGVIGQIPLIQPGTAFEYSSSVPLQCDGGFMDGELYFESSQEPSIFRVKLGQLCLQVSNIE